MHDVLMAVLSDGMLLFLVAFYAYFFFGNKFANRLKIHHESAWLVLGSPDVLNPLSSKAKLIPYLSRREYLSLNDQLLSRLGSFARAALYASVASIVVLLVSGFTMFFLYVGG